MPPPFIFFLVLIVAILTFVVALVSLANRRKERETFYLNETIKKLTETPGSSIAEFLHAHDLLRRRRLREGMTVGGLVGVLGAVGLMIFLYAISKVGEPVWLVGLIPMLACTGLLVYALLISPRE